MSLSKSYYHFKYEVNSHYEDSISSLFSHQQKFAEILRVVLSSEDRLLECIQESVSINISRIENDDLKENKDVVESYSALPFIEILVSNIKFNYWYEDEDGEEWEYAFPEEVCITFNKKKEALYWAKGKTPLLLKGYEGSSTTTGLKPSEEDNLSFVFESLFESENKYDWNLKALIDSKLNHLLSELEGTALTTKEESSFGFLNLVYENGASIDTDIHNFITHYDSDLCDFR